MNEDDRIANFLFEVGTMRKLIRMHRQVLLTDDLSDSISSHSYRVALIAWHLAKKENADPYKTTMMGLIHDMAEARSGDHNWVQKRYVKVFEDEIIEDQFGTLPYKDLLDMVKEYNERKTKEAILAKDADLLDQVLLLREYEWQGNKEAHEWLHGRKTAQTEDHKVINAQLANVKSEAGKKLGEAIMKQNPSDWWDGIWTSKNR
ncbi:HD domain-containing protein [Patescibacteria group bacterium]|nr:HD domain-containing protein [Patescibacteria group bacterium]